MYSTALVLDHCTVTTVLVQYNHVDLDIDIVRAGQVYTRKSNSKLLHFVRFFPDTARSLNRSGLSGHKRPAVGCGRTDGPGPWQGVSGAVSK